MQEKRVVVETKTQELFNFNTFLVNSSNENNDEKLNNSIMFNQSQISEVIQHDTEFETKEFEIAIQATNMVPSSNSFTYSSQTNNINGNKNFPFFEEIRNDKKLNPDDTLNFTNSHKSTSSNSHRDNKLKQNNSAGVPQTLISCLDDLQASGNLVSWKVSSVGENLSVKVTWNNDNLTARNIFNNEKIRNLSLYHEIPIKPKNIDSSFEYNDLKFVVAKYENVAKIKNELNRLNLNLSIYINNLTDFLSLDTFKQNQDSDEFFQFLLSKHSSIRSLVLSCEETLVAEMNDPYLDDFRPYDIVRLLIMNEIEKCLKLRPGKLFKEIEYSNNRNSLDSFEEQIASHIIRKHISKNKFNSLVDLLIATNNSSTNFMNRNKTNNKSFSNGKKQETKYVDSNDRLVKSLNSMLSEPLKQSSTQEIYNENETNSPNEDYWEENWSFIEKTKSIDSKKSKSNGVLTIPEPKDKILPKVGDQVPDNMSDTIISHNNLLNDDEKDFEEDIQADMNQSTTKNKEPKSKNLSKLNLNNDNDYDNEISSNKFPIPKNILKIKSKSSSYYRTNDERLESETESEFGSVSKSVNKNENQNDSNQDSRIRPNPNINDPIFLQRPIDKLIRLGEAVRFVCKVEGTKPLEVFWYKMDGDELKNDEKYEIYHDDQFYYLKIFNTVQNDQGMYLCVISNDFEQNIDSFNLQFRDNNREFKRPKFLLELSDLDVEEGYSATFKVKIEFGYPKARVLFYRNKVLLLNDKRHEIYYCGDGVYHLHIAKVNEEDNSQYACVAINNSGRVSTTAELYVLERENIKRPDMMLKLQGPSSYKALNNSISNIDSTKDFAIKSNMYSPKSYSESDKLTDSFPYLTTASISTTSYDIWLDSYTNNKLINDQDLLKPVSDNKSLEISKNNQTVEEKELTKKSTNSIKRRNSEQIKMDVSYQSMPELNILLKLNEPKFEVNTFDNNQSPAQFSNKSEDLKETELHVINDLEETCRANEASIFPTGNMDTKKPASQETQTILNDASLPNISESINITYIKASESFQKDFEQFKSESVKELKKLWEQPIGPISGDRSFTKKSKSTIGLNKETLDESRRSSFGEGIKKGDVSQTKSQFSVSPSENSSAFINKPISDEIYYHSDLETARIVKKLKEKFDNMDESFNKTKNEEEEEQVASLTCRNTGKLNNNSILSNENYTLETNNKKPLLSIQTSKPDAPRHSEDRAKNLKIINSISNQSIDSTPISTSDTISSSFSTLNQSSSQKKQKILNKEIKSLLDIAENRTANLCKVYDSSLSMPESANIPFYKNVGNNNKSTDSFFVNESKKVDLSQSDADTFQSIIHSNYLKSSKKKSNVISKVKLWDELLEKMLENSQQPTRPEQWEKEFN